MKIIIITKKKKQRITPELDMRVLQRVVLHFARRRRVLDLAFQNDCVCTTSVNA